MTEVTDPHDRPTGPDGPGGPRAAAEPADLQLLCLPHAGGAAGAYAGWSGLMPPRVSVRAVELPGHGTRLREPPLTDLDELVKLLRAELSALVTGPYLLFGHSLGALLAFELARALRDDHGEPLALIVAGRNAPSLPSAHRPIHQLGDREFLAALRGYGGTPQALLDEPELVELFLPALRADITMAETYVRRPGPAGLHCPVAVFSGRHDPLVDDLGLVAWRHETAGPFALGVLDGGHFFLNSQAFRDRLVDVLAAVGRDRSGR